MSQPPRVEWDLLSHTRKPSYPGAAAPRHVEEKNPMSISETGLLKSLGGTLECVARVSTILRHIPPRES